MNSVTAALFLGLVFFVMMHVVSSRVQRCSQNPEVPQNLWPKDHLKSSRFLYGSDSNTVVKNSVKCQIEEGIHPDFWAALVTLVNELDNKRKCTFDESEWRWLEKKLVGEGKRITNKSGPDIYVIPNFLTSHQCQKLIDIHGEISNSSINEKWKFATTKQLLEAVYKSSLSPNEYNIFFETSSNCDGGRVEGSEIGEKLEKVLNFSSSVLIPRGESVFVDFVEERIQEVTGLPRTNAFHSQLIEYQTNSEYRAHTDCHGVENDRMATIIIYLTDVEEGGETKFPYLNKTIQPKRGMAVVWKNLDSKGQCDVRTTHIAGLVNKGKKYIYQKWFYEKPILPKYGDSEYVFCDLSQSCRQYIYRQSTVLATQYAEKGLEASNYSEELKNYKLALHNQPLHSASLILYADVLNELGHPLQALPYLLSLLKMHPRNEDGLEILRLVMKTLEERNFYSSV